MAQKRELEENPYAAPVDEEFLASARQYRDNFEEEPEFQEALELWPRCPECGRRRVTRCPICKTSGDLFPLADQEYFDPDAQPLPPPTRGGCGCGGKCGHGGDGGSGCGGHEEEADDDVIDVETAEEKERRSGARRRAWAKLAKKSEKFRTAPDPSEDAEPTPALLCHVCSEAFVPVFPRYCEWCNHDFGSGEEYEVDGEISPEVEDFLRRKAQQEDAAFEANPDRVMWTIAVLGGALALFLAYWYFIL